MPQIPTRFTATLKTPGELTDREGQVLVLICEGGTLNDIARRLGISKKTVETHVGHIADKLGVNSLRQITIAAFADSLVQVVRSPMPVKPENRYAAILLLLTSLLGGVAIDDDDNFLRQRAPRGRHQTLRISAAKSGGTAGRKA